MAIAGSTPQVEGSYEIQAPVNPQDNLTGLVQYAPTATPTPVRSAIVDSEYNPTSHLVNHIEGAPMTVDYIRQILGADDTAKPLQLGVAASNQYYEKIRNMIFRVTTPFSASQDSDTNEFTVTGEANVFYGLRPNIGDMFYADTGDGYLGLLALTSVERLTYMKSSAYAVQYRLIDRLGPQKTTSEYFSDIEGKVVRVLVFDPELLEQTDNPFVTENDYEQFRDLAESQEMLREYFIGKFWLAETQGYCIPQQPTRTFDGFHSLFCRQIGFVDARRHVLVHQLGLLNYDQVETIWDMIKDVSIRKLPIVLNKLGVYPARSFRAGSTNRGIGYTLYTSCLAPWDTAAINAEYTIPVAPDAFKRILSDFDDKVLPSYRPVDYDAFYVLSEAFYNDNYPGMCNFERLISQMLKSKAIDPTLIIKMVGEYYELPLLEQFYYGPILYTLIGYVRRNPQWK